MANTGNPETDTLDIVAFEQIKGLLGRTISAKEGMSQEVFQDGEHRASVLLPGAVNVIDSSKQRQQMNVRNSTIVQINLGLALYSWDGELHTAGESGGYTQRYHAEVQIHVVEPPCFALHCYYHRDPVQLAQKAIHQALDVYAGRTEHDAVDPTQLRYLAETTLLTGRGARMDDDRVTGLKVVRAMVRNVSDPRRTKVLEDKQRAKIKEEELLIKERETLLREEELRLTSQQHEAELRYQAEMKTRELQTQSEYQTLEERVADTFQTLKETFQHDHQTRNTEYQRQEEAKRREAERHEQVRRSEFEREEESRRKKQERSEREKDEETDWNAQVRATEWQHLLDTKNRAYDQQVKADTRVEMVQEQSFELEYEQRKLIGQSKLDEVRQEQASEKAAYQRHEETLQKEHERGEDRKHYHHEMEKRVEELSFEQKQAFLNQIREPLGEQVIKEIYDGRSPEDVGRVIQNVFNPTQSFNNEAPRPQGTKITQEDPAFLPRHYRQTAEEKLQEREEEEEEDFEEFTIHKRETMYIPRMGLALIEAELPRRQRAHLKLDGSIVFLIWKVDRNSSAARTHLQIGDMLTGINQRGLKSRQALSEILLECMDEASVELTIIRSNQYKEWRIELPES